MSDAKGEDVPMTTDSQDAEDAAAAVEPTATDSEQPDGSGDGQVEPAKVAVKGSLDKDVIRRVVRSHFSEVQACYTEELKKDPTLAGRVAIQFKVAPSGRVSAAVVNSTTLGNREVGNCVAEEVAGWQFPKPSGGGNVVVTYPFEFAPG